MNELKIEGQNYYFIARRADRPWGHAINVSVFSNQNIVLGNLSFCCHPEFENFSLYQNYETSKLVQIASELIAQGMKSNSYKTAWEADLTITLRLNGFDMGAPIAEHQQLGFMVL